MAASNPGRLSDVERDALVRRYNAAVVAAGTSQAERVDVQALARDMATAAADPTLGDERAAELARRYNAAILQGPERRTTQALRGELASTDLATRMRAAAELQQRRELDDGVADEIVGAYNAEVQAANERGLDPAEVPEEFRPAAAAIQAQLERLQAAEATRPTRRSPCSTTP